ncbi:MAG: OB-fold domain-containing protein, partial [Actinomycetota bacterium]
WNEVTPYVLAYVELDEGPRLMTNIVGGDPADVAVDAPVQVVWDDTGEGNALPRFELV